VKKNGQGAVPIAKVLCLAKDCLELVQPYLPLCKLCYLQSMAGKVSVLALRDGLGDAVFYIATKKLDFPAGAPKSRFPQKGLKKGKKILMGRPMHCANAAEDGSKETDGRVICLPCNLPNQDFGIADFSLSSADTLVFPHTTTNQEIRIAVGRDFSVLSEDTLDLHLATAIQQSGIAVDGDDTSGLASSGISSTVKCLLSAGASSTLLYVDSGAGQSLSSCSTAFSQMVPCQVEITGIAGALQIYGCGTANFLYDSGSGDPVLLRVHNCLYGHGEFHLLSVSQICQREGNSVDFTLSSPTLVLRSKRRQIRIALAIEDGLFAIPVTPFQMDDPRYSTLPKFDVTPNGDFRLSDDLSSHRWSSRVLVSASSNARFLVASRSDFDCNLTSFCGNFLAPPSIPAARRQYNPAVQSDMVDLTTRFLGLGDERLCKTIELSNGLASPPSKANAKVSRVKPFFPHGRWNEGKTPRVSKGKIGNLHHAKVGEVVFTDTFESGDIKYKYGQAYYGDIKYKPYVTKVSGEKFLNLQNKNRHEQFIWVVIG
jgi:hypothetical protein